MHAANKDGRGYAHPYDDASRAGGPDQSGFVNDPNPKLFTVTVGGGEGGNGGGGGGGGDGGRHHFWNR